MRPVAVISGPRSLATKDTDRYSVLPYLAASDCLPCTTVTNSIFSLAIGHKGLFTAIVLVLVHPPVIPTVPSLRHLSASHLSAVEQSLGDCSPIGCGTVNIGSQWTNAADWAGLPARTHFPLLSMADHIAYACMYWGLFPQWGITST